jgi:lipid-A-disaccharide synthase
MLFGHARLALHAAEAAIVASGTATLEAALARCPMVITYRLSPLTYRMVMRRKLLPYFGLPNILAASSSCPSSCRRTRPCQSGAGAGQLARQQGRARAHPRPLRGLHESLACGHEQRLVQALAPYLRKPPDRR